MMRVNLEEVVVPSKDIELLILGSKSETNRLLILQAMHSGITLSNSAHCDDSQAMTEALRLGTGLIDIGHAGTAMRFLTAYFAGQSGASVVLTGSERMQNRPIGVLVDALRSIGADINYQGKEGYPPLLIKGKTLDKNAVEISGRISSQYLTALMLLGTKLKNGLIIKVIEGLTSLPYLKMTKSLIERVGGHVELSATRIVVHSLTSIGPQEIAIDSDWSSASYWYSFVALSAESKIRLGDYSLKSIQGDSDVARIYEMLGVSTIYQPDQRSVELMKTAQHKVDHLELDLSGTPDLAQTIAVTCAGLGISCHLTGLHTLKIKETDRLLALKQELEKFGAQVDITDDAMQLKAQGGLVAHDQIETYDDHRMAMAFAPLVQKMSLSINEAQVVTKSYPEFWQDLSRAGVKMTFEN